MNKLVPIVAVLASTSALAQIPDAEVLLAAEGGSLTPGAINEIQDVRGGEDSGWVSRCRVIDPGGVERSVLMGEFRDDDPAGVHVLRARGTYGGLTQVGIGNARLAQGRLGYVSGVVGSAGLTGWLDDTPVAREGQSAGPGVGDWTRILQVQPLVGGGALIEGIIETPSQGPRRTLLHYPSGAIVFQALQGVTGSSEVVAEIRSIDASPSGNHVAAVAVLAPSGDRAVLLDGAIYQLEGGVPARTGESAQGTLPPPANGTFLEFVEAFATDSGEVVLEARVDLAFGSYRDSVFRGGRECFDAAWGLCGIDATGGALTGTQLDPYGTEFEGEPIPFTRRGVDTDGDGVSDRVFELRTGLQEPSISGTGRVYRNTTMTIQNVTNFAVGASRSALKRADPIVCTGRPNSGGRSAALRTVGTEWAGYNRLKLFAWGLPTNSFGLPLASRTAAAATPLAGSDGELCLGGFVGRLGPSIMNPTFSGSGSADLYLNLFPGTGGYVSALPGETWYLQMWYRDVVGSTATSNLTDAIAVTLK